MSHAEGRAAAWRLQARLGVTSASPLVFIPSVSLGVPFSFLFILESLIQTSSLDLVASHLWVTRDSLLALLVTRRPDCYTILRSPHTPGKAFQYPLIANLFTLLRILILSFATPPLRHPLTNPFHLRTLRLTLRDTLAHTLRRHYNYLRSPE